MSGGLGFRTRLDHRSVLPVIVGSPLSSLALQLLHGSRGRYLIAWGSMVASGVLSGECKQIREWKSAMTLGTSSQGDPTSFNDDEKSVF